MERSEIQGKAQAIPDSASLHPGYRLGAQTYIAPPHLTPHPVKTTKKRLYHRTNRHSMANPHLNKDPGAIIASPDEAFGPGPNGALLKK
jgi:hypothetical protein